MKAEDIFEAVGNIDDKYIEDSEIAKLKRNLIKFIVPFAACLCICIVCAVVAANARMGKKETDSAAAVMYDNVEEPPEEGDFELTGMGSSKSDSSVVEDASESCTDEQDMKCEVGEDTPVQTKTYTESVSSTVPLSVKEKTETVDGSVHEEKVSASSDEQSARINYAVKAIDEADRNKINKDKSYLKEFFGDETGEEYFVIYLDADEFYYEVTVTAALNKVVKTEKFDK